MINGCGRILVSIVSNDYLRADLDGIVLSVSLNGLSEDLLKKNACLESSGQFLNVDEGISCGDGSSMIELRLKCCGILLIAF